ncbi:hypothetical protein V491_03075 [Pseudogymnoascus sp. VKM F-3775]|nr:hypothetical protein V491_03075 [Pseudogymnoascus sp. VKM F-3775]
MSIPKPEGPDIDIGMSRGLRAYVPATDSNDNRPAYAGVMLDIVFHRTSSGNSKSILATPDYSAVWARGLFYAVVNTEPFGPLCSMCGRTSFIILLFQLFGTTTFRRWLFYFLAAETLIVNLVTCITIYTQCENVKTIWDPVGTPSKCWPPAVQADIGFFQGASNSATDLILTLIPISIFFSLQMNLRLKIGLGALLCLSVFAFASSIVKTVKLKTIGDKSDYSHNTVSFMNWVVVENTFVIIGASIPLIRPLFTRSRDLSLTGYITNTPYEMNSRSQSGANGTSSAPQRKLVGLQTSSEENILPIHGGPGQATNIESTNSLGSEHDTKVR